MRNPYRGTGVAIVTPFSGDEINYAELSQVLDHVIEGGVNYIVALGSTGEAATISDTESRQLLDHIIRHVDQRIPIVAGNFGGNNTRALKAKISNYNFDGIDAILSASPSYNKPSQQGIYEHYQQLADAATIPIILYNVPSRTASNMTANTTVKLSRHTQIIGIKEASGDLTQAKDIIKATEENFFLTSGDDILAPAIAQAGGIGVISVLANALPKQFSTMIKGYLDNEIEAAREIEQSLSDLHHWMYVEGNPSGVKTAMKILGICSDEVRLPLTKVSAETYRQIDYLLKQL